jgi:hypothetical protein
LVDTDCVLCTERLLGWQMVWVLALVLVFLGRLSIAREVQYIILYGFGEERPDCSVSWKRKMKRIKGIVGAG